MDADKHRELAEKYGIEGFPTIKIFKGGQVSDYDGEREAKGIVKYVRRHLGVRDANVGLVKLASVEESGFLTGGTALIGFFREPTIASAIFHVFEEVCSEELPSLTATPIKAAYSASYGTDKIAISLGVKTAPAIVLFRPNEEPLHLAIPRKREQFTEEYLLEWLQGALK